MDKEKIELAKQLLEQAHASLAQAKQVLTDITGVNFSADIRAKAATLIVPSPDSKIIEGIFDGRQVMDAEGKRYQVAENYASKSKLVQGDRMKLIINPDGSYIYKQIGPVERKHIVGTLVLEDDQYKVVAEGRSYNVLTASVTYYRLQEGDQVTITVPTEGEANWAAVESAVMKV